MVVSTPKLFRSSSFRLAALYMLLFGASALLLLGFIYWSTAGYMARQADAAIQADIDLLAERYRTSGLPGLTALIAERINEDPGRSNLYLLTDDSYNRIVGNLDNWPEVDADPKGWLSFRLRDAGSPKRGAHGARARTFRVGGGFRLLVGRDMYELEAIRDRIIDTLTWGLAITLVLALGGGIAMSRSMLRRLEVINETSREIMTGDLSRRIPVRGSQDEFDELVNHLNAMLDRISVLMEDVRRVSDSIAHDLKTPLTRLRNDLEILKGNTDDDSAARENAEQALLEADGLLSTFNALLRIARIESGHRRAGFTDVPLADLVRDVAEFYDPLAEENGLSLSLDIESEPVLRGDRDLLFQALANLLDNAIKYTPSGGAVTIQVQVDAAASRIVITDSGPGIARDQRDMVFQRFYRVENSRSAPGSGLGLSLVAAVAKLHDAQIVLQDNGPGLRAVLSFPFQQST